jgi:hypothetical protein
VLVCATYSGVGDLDENLISGWQFAVRSRLDDAVFGAFEYSDVYAHCGAKKWVVNELSRWCASF